MPSKDALLPKFTAGEVAENLRISKRTLRRYLRIFTNIHPIRSGRDLLFTDADLKALEENLRQWRSNSSHPENERTTPSSSSGARSVDETLTTLRGRQTSL